MENNGPISADAFVNPRLTRIESKVDSIDAHIANLDTKFADKESVMALHEKYFSLSRDVSEIKVANATMQGSIRTEIANLKADVKVEITTLKGVVETQVQTINTRLKVYGAVLTVALTIAMFLINLYFNQN